jgi:hypothetical protein
LVDNLLGRMVLIFYGAGLSDDRDDPVCGVVAGLNFHDRTHQPPDERSIYRQGSFLATMLVITETPRHFFTRRLERLHVSIQVEVRQTSWR